MTIRQFIFCDICNPQAVRSIEFRRAPRKDERTGRRISDGRAWFEGELKVAIDQGWTLTLAGQHICPSCKHNIV
jgi:hypothetical protein